MHIADIKSRSTSKLPSRNDFLWTFYSTLKSAEGSVRSHKAARSSCRRICEKKNTRSLQSSEENNELSTMQLKNKLISSLFKSDAKKSPSSKTKYISVHNSPMQNDLCYLTKSFSKKF